MYIDGYCVDSLDSFRIHFSLSALLDYLNQPVIFKKWISAIQNTDSVSEHNNLLELDKAFLHWCNHTENPEVKSPEDFIFRHPENQILFQNYNKDNNKNLCYILYLLIELSDVILSDQEIQIASEFLASRTSLLRICLDSDGLPVLYQGTRKIDILSRPQNLSQFPELISATQDPDTGFLGISQDGRLVNGSALWIPVLSKKPVKVLLCQNLYAILLEDGSILHNFLWDPPQIPAENISIQGDRLIATPVFVF